MNVRSVNLVDSQVGTKFIMLSRNQSLSVVTNDFPLIPGTNLLFPEYYCTESKNGKIQYDYHLTIPEQIKSSPDNVLLADFQSKRGDKVIVYLEKDYSVSRNRVTIYNPKESVNAIINPGGLLEIVFINPKDPQSLPSFNETGASFGLELIRREIVCDKDSVFRPNNNLFDIRRWVAGACQVHLFFRVCLKDLDFLSQTLVEGHLFGPTINLFNNGKAIECDSQNGSASNSIKTSIYLNKSIKSKLREMNNSDHIKTLNEAIWYGTEQGMFNGTLILGNTSNAIMVDRQTGYQEVEICLPFEKVNFEMVRYEPYNLSGRVQANGYRVVNNKYFHRFVIISDLARYRSCDNSWNGIGKAQFKQGSEIHEFPVLVGNYGVDRTKKFKEIINLPVVKKIRVAKVKLEKISIGKEITFEKSVMSSSLSTSDSCRTVEDPADQSTICMFPGETIKIIMNNETIPWSVASFPILLYESGRKSNKDKKTEEFKFFCTPCTYNHARSPSPMVFESGKQKKTVYIQIIV